MGSIITPPHLDYRAALHDGKTANMFINAIFSSLTLPWLIPVIYLCKIKGLITLSYPGVTKRVATVTQSSRRGQGPAALNVYNSYLPGKGDTMIKKVVHPW